MSHFVHIVCFDAPAPPDYGGAIDLYYKIKSLAESGKEILLHYYDYKPYRNTNGLEKYCVEINAYPRKKIISSLSFTQPFIVSSRINKELIARLNKDNYPIILEGLHTTGIIPFIKNNKRIIVRMHNEEGIYYNHLAKAETRWKKKLFFLNESRLITYYQKKLDPSLPLACISRQDVSEFEKMGFKNVHFIPGFIPWTTISIKEGNGDYCLYHGNMSVSENEEAALWLIKNVFSKLNVKFIVAGKGISKKLQVLASSFSNITLINAPSQQQLNELIQKAHINVAPSMNNTGVKLKLLHALFQGRYCIANHNAVKGGDLSDDIIIAEDPSQYLKIIPELMNASFTSVQISGRQKILETYNNQLNADKLIELLMHCQ